jgi:hypothetical protein
VLLTAASCDIVAGALCVGTETTLLYDDRIIAEYGRRWAGYYDGFPEHQADELGGVDRARRQPGSE